jgi:Zinc finger, C2H2 type
MGTYDDDFDEIQSINGGEMYHQQLMIDDTVEVMEQHQQQQLIAPLQTVAEHSKEDREKSVLDNTCVLCSLAFKNLNALEKHLLTEHILNVPTTIMPAASGSHNNNVLKLDAMPGGVAGSAYKTNTLTEESNKRLLESADGGSVSPHQPQVESPKIETPNTVLQTCVLCSLAFKNPNALEKHLLTVHTVNVLTTIMPAAGESHNNVFKIHAMPGGVAGSAYKTMRYTTIPFKLLTLTVHNKRLLESADGGSVSPHQPAE